MNGLFSARRVAALVAVAALAVPASAGANGGGGGGGAKPKQDFVIGSTLRTLLGPSAGQKVLLSVGAYSGASGQNPQGLVHVYNQTQNTSVFSEVKCLRVQGKIASAGVVVVKSNDPLFPTGSAHHWWFDDNGVAALRKDGAFSTPPGAVVDPNTCPTPVEFTRDNVAGGYLVHDSQP